MLEVQLAAIEQQAREASTELVALRELLTKHAPASKSKRRGVTPPEAVESFRRDPKGPVTVEFGVQRIGYPDGPIAVGDDPEPAIGATWDNYLPGGGTFTAFVPPSVYRQLTLPNPEGPRKPLTPGRERLEVVEHVEQHGIRVTGILREDGGHYRIVVDSPDDVVLYIKGSGM